MHGRFKRINCLRNFFVPKHCSILGIDITSASVKILEISGNAERLCVENYGREVLPAHALDGKIIKDIDAIASCIRKLVNQLATNCKQVVLAVPDAAIISKIVSIDAGLNDEELEELIVIEADKHIPYPINEINLDFEILGHSEKNHSLLEVLIVASRAENVNSRVEAVTRAGLDVLVVDVESFAVERAVRKFAQQLPAAGQDKTIAIIDIGAHYTHLFVLHGMKLIYARDENFGGMQLVEAIARHYQLTIEQAVLAQEHGTLPADYEAQVLVPFKDTMLVQIKRTLHFFYSASQEEQVEHILLAGGLAQLPGLVRSIQEQLGVTTTVANPFSNMSFGTNIQLYSLNQDAPSLMVACGLALRNIE